MLEYSELGYSESEYSGSNCFEVVAHFVTVYFEVDCYAPTACFVEKVYFVEEVRFVEKVYFGGYSGFVGDREAVPCLV